MSRINKEGASNAISHIVGILAVPLSPKELERYEVLFQDDTESGWDKIAAVDLLSLCMREHM